MESLPVQKPRLSPTVMIYAGSGWLRSVVWMEIQVRPVAEVNAKESAPVLELSISAKHAWESTKSSCDRFCEGCISGLVASSATRRLETCRGERTRPSTRRSECVEAEGSLTLEDIGKGGKQP